MAAKKKTTKRKYRPRLQPARSHQQQVRFTPAEFAQLTAEADRRRVSISDVIREALRTAKVIRTGD